MQNLIKEKKQQRDNMASFHGGVLFFFLGLGIAIVYGPHDFLAIWAGAIIAALGLISIKYMPSLEIEH